MIRETNIGIDIVITTVVIIGMTKITAQEGIARGLIPVGILDAGLDIGNMIPGKNHLTVITSPGKVIITGVIIEMITIEDMGKDLRITLSIKEVTDIPQVQDGLRTETDML
jgi:hypothetical protein